MNIIALPRCHTLFNLGCYFIAQAYRLWLSFQSDFANFLAFLPEGLQVHTSLCLPMMAHLLVVAQAPLVLWLQLLHGLFVLLQNVA